MPILPPVLARHARLLGAAAVLLFLATWGMEWSGVVEACLYCQVERTVIGLLGLLMLLSVRGSWAMLYAASVLAFFGAATAATQHFNGWMAINKGEFKGFTPIYANGFVLSAAAVAIIIGQWLILRGLQTSETPHS